jgi:Spy/CpxP family protein refolding chaperone
MTSITKSKLSLYLGVIFIAGVVSGSVITLRKAQTKAQPPSMENVCHKMQDSLKAKLGLTDEQFAKVRPILEQTAQEIQSIHGRTMQEIDAAIRRSHDELAKHLTPEQKQKLEEMDIERRDWMMRRAKRLDGLSARPPASL